MPLRFSSTRALSTATALFLAATAISHVHAQQGDGQPLPHTATITVNARLVVLDVVVTDKSGKAVDGLTRKDFKVYEDKAEQGIRSFEPPSSHVLPAESASATSVFDPAAPAAFGNSPVTILVLDQLNTHFADSSFARRSLRDYLAQQPAVLAQPTTLLAVYDNNFKLRQEFTRDRDALLRALAATPTEYAWRLEVNGKAEYGPLERLDQSLRALEQIAQSYSRIHGRKNLIWVGGGFPSIDPTMLDGDDSQEVKDTLQHVTDVLLDTRITLYAVDPTSSAVANTEITDYTQLAFAGLAGDAMTLGSDPFNSAEDFDRLGPVTGGRVVRGMNNIAQQIASSVELGADFYTIGYAPSSSSDAAGQYRNIRVVCLVPGLTATTRMGYYTERTTQEKSAVTIGYDLATAAESTIPLNGLHVTVEPASELNSYVVRVAVPSLTWQPDSDGTAKAQVAVMAAYLSPKNRMLGHTLHGMTAIAVAGTNLRDSNRTADFTFTIQPARKATVLRFVVRDTATGRMGSVDLPMPK